MRNSRQGKDNDGEMSDENLCDDEIISDAPVIRRHYHADVCIFVASNGIQS